MPVGVVRHAKPIDADTARAETAQSSSTGDDFEPLRIWSLSDPEQILRIYHQGLSSAADLRDAEVSYHLWERCDPWVRNKIQEQPQVIGDAVRLMNDARAEMRRRCGGFLRTPLTELQRQQEELSARLNHPLAPTSGYQNTLPRSLNEASVARFRAHLRANIASGDVNHLLWTEGAISDWLDYLSNAPLAAKNASREFVGLEDPRTVSELARCELGFDCSGSSLDYLDLCGGLGMCAGSKRALLLSWLPNAERRENAKASAQKLAAALRAGDARALGLDEEILRAE